MIKKISTTLGIGIVCVILGVVLFTRIEVLTQFAEIIREKAQNTHKENKQLSAFGEKTDTHENTKLSEETEIAFTNKPDDYLIFKYAWGLISIPKDETWDYKKIPVLAKIESVNNAENTIDIIIEKPINNPEFGRKKTFKLNTCTKDITYMSVENQVFTGRLDYLDSLKNGMTLITFCSNSKCTSFDRLCKFFNN